LRCNVRENEVISITLEINKYYFGEKRLDLNKNYMVEIKIMKDSI